MRYNNRDEWLILAAIAAAAITFLVMIYGIFPRLTAQDASTVNELHRMSESLTKLEMRVDALEAHAQEVEKPAPTVSAVDEAQTHPGMQEKATSYKITFYCSCAKCCGKSDGITASGKKARAGRTVAAPKSFKFGTRLYIEGIGERVVEDRGGSIKGNRLDVYVNSHDEALRLGVKTAQVEVTND